MFRSSPSCGCFTFTVSTNMFRHIKCQCNSYSSFEDFLSCKSESMPEITFVCKVWDENVCGMRQNPLFHPQHSTQMVFILTYKFSTFLHHTEKKSVSIEISILLVSVFDLVFCCCCQRRRFFHRSHQHQKSVKFLTRNEFFYHTLSFCVSRVV